MKYFPHKNNIFILLFTVCSSFVLYANKSTNKPETISSNSFFTTPPPTGLSTQIYTGEKTLEFLTLTGNNIQWYATPAGGSVLQSSTALIDNTTYYASQTIDGAESERRFGVTVKRVGDATYNASLNTTLNDIPLSLSGGTTAKWYANAADSTPLANTTPLTNGATYYVEQYAPAYTVSTYIGRAFQNPTYAVDYNWINWPAGSVFDTAGNLYIADNNNNNILKVATTGEVSVFAGSENGESGFVNGIGIAARFDNPTGLVMDANGNLYVSDSGNKVVRKITPDGEVSTFTDSYTKSNGEVADFWYLNDITIDLEGNLYFIEDREVYKATPSGETTLVNDQMDNAYNIVIDSQGNLFVTSGTENVIYKITNSGELSIFAGNEGIEGTTNGVGTNASFTDPRALAIDSQDNLYVMMGHEEYTLRKITPEAVVTTVAGNGVEGFSDGVGTAAQFGTVYYMQIDVRDNLYISDLTNDSVRKVITTATRSNRIPFTVNLVIEKPEVAGTFFFYEESTLSDIQVQGSNIKWYSASENGTALPLTTNLVDGTTYYVTQTINGIESERTAVKVIFTTPPPTGLNTQIYAGNATLADVVLTGDNIQWYATPAGGSVLQSSTALIDNTTYYASQTIDGAESERRFGVTVKRVGDETYNMPLNTTLNDIPLSLSGGTTAKWYANAADSTPLANTTPLTNGATYYVEQYAPAYTVSTYIGRAFQNPTYAVDYNWINWPAGSVFDTAGNLYIADNSNNNILKVATTGEVSVFAGSENGESGFVDGIGTAARFNQPKGLAIDANGNLYVSDSINKAIRKITPDGEVSTFTDSYTKSNGEVADFWYLKDITIDLEGNLYFIEDDKVYKATPSGATTLVNDQMDNAYNIVIDSQGNLFVTSGTENVIYKITNSGELSIFAGNEGIEGTTNGVGTNASFTDPRALAIDSQDNLYVMMGHEEYTLRKITPEAVVTTVAGNGVEGFSDGVGTTAQFGTVYYMHVDVADNLYISDLTNDSVRKVITTATTSNRIPITINFVLPAPVTAHNLQIYAGNKTLAAITVTGTDIKWYAAETSGNQLPLKTKLVSGTTYYASQTIEGIESSRLAVTVQQIGPSEQFINANGINTIGDLTSTPSTGYEAKWFATENATDILEATEEVTSGTYFIEQHKYGSLAPYQVSTYIAAEVLATFLEEEFYVDAIAFDASGTMFLAVYLDDSDEEVILKVTPDQQISYFVGNGNGRFVDTNNQPIEEASFGYIRDMEFDSNGNLFVVDSNVHVVFKVLPNGTVSVFAGTPTETGTTDGMGMQARFNEPISLAIDALDNLFIYDDNGNIRKISPQGNVTTIPTDGQIPSNGAIAVDESGNMYIDIFGSAIYKLSPNGTGELLAGSGDENGATDGIGSAARFENITDILLDKEGNLFVVDADNSIIRRINLISKEVVTIAGSGDNQLTNGSGTDASFLYPFKITKNAQGNYYIIDGNTIRLLEQIKRSNRVAVVLNSIEAPTGLSTQIYTGEKTLEFLTVFGENIQWYNSSTEGALLASDRRLVSGETYYASQTLNGFEGDNRLAVTVQKISEDTQVLNSLNSRVENLITTPSDAHIVQWYPSMDSKTPIATNTILQTGTYFVAQENLVIPEKPVITSFIGKPSIGAFIGETNFSITAITKDNSGGLFVAVAVPSSESSVILQISATAEITYLVGGGYGDFVNEAGITTSDYLSIITDMVSDTAGNLFLAQPNFNTILKVATNGVVSVFAGSSGEVGSTNGTGAAARFDFPERIAIDAIDNLYVFDSDSRQIRKITPARDVSTIFSDGESDFESYGAMEIAEDGTLFVDIFGGFIIKITPSGESEIIAGSFEEKGNADGIGAEARFDGIIDLALDNQGNLIVIDANNETIRKVAIENNNVTTLIDEVTPGSISPFGDLQRITKSTQSDYYFLDNDHIFLMQGKSISNRVAVDVVTATPPPEGLTTQIYAGTKTLAALTVTGTSVKWHNKAVDGNELSMDTVLEDGVTYYASQEVNGLESVVRLPVKVQRISDSIQKMNVSKATIVQNLKANVSRGYNAQWFENESSTATLDNSVSITNGATYAVSQYIPAYNAITYAGSENVGNADGFNEKATFEAPKDMVFDAYGNLFITDTGNHLIRKISTTGSVTTFAGTGSEGAANGTGTAASFNMPRGIVIDSNGNLFVADSKNYLIRKITPEGEVSTFAGNGESANVNGTGTSASFTFIEGMSIDSENNIYVSDTDNKIRKITPEAVVSDFAGASVGGGNIDGTINVSSFNHPKGMVFDEQGNLFVADSKNHAIRKITTNGIVSTFAGNGEIGADDGLGSLASFNRPTGLAIDTENNLYVTDTDNRRIRKITPAGLVTTIVGNGNEESVNGVGLNASLKHPSEIVFDGFGSLYVTEEDQILKINIKEETSNKVNVTVEFDAPRPNGLGLQIYAGTKTLNDLSITGTAVKWYASSNSSSILDATTNLVDGATYYATQTLNNVESSNRFAVAVKKISEATQTLSLPSEATVANLVATPSAGYEAKWYADIDSQETLLSSAPIRSATYYVAQEKITPLPNPNISTFSIRNAEDLFGSDTFFAKIITVDAEGFLYVGGELLDAGEFVLLKISPSGFGRYLFGNSAGSFVDENGSPTSENISDVLDMVLDREDNLFLAESSANKILKVTPEGIVSVFAGTGNNGANDGTGLSASFDYPTGLAIDLTDNLYVVDYNNDLLRKISPQRNVTTIQPVGVSEVPSNGSIIADANGNLYLDILGVAIYKNSSQGIPELIAGDLDKNSIEDGIGENSSFKNIQDISFDASGNLMVLDDTKIRKVDLLTKTVTTIAGTENAITTDGTGLLAGFEAPAKITKNTFGKHYLIDNGIVRTLSYQNTSNRVAVSVKVKETPTLSFSAIAKTYGDADFTIEATTNSSAAIEYSIVTGGTGEITLTGNTVSIVKAGTVLLKASIEEDANYKAAEVTTVLSIAKADQTITFNTLTVPTGGDTFNLEATASSGLPVSFESSNTSVITITNNVATIVGAGTSTILAKQNGNDNYNPAESVLQTLEIAKEIPELVFEDFTKTYGDADFTIEATTNSSAAIEYSIVTGGTGEITLTGTMVSIVKAGTVLLKASIEEDANYKAAEVTTVLTIAKADQTITFNTLTVPTGGDTFNLEATASSGLPVSFESSNTSVITITNNVATIVGAGTSTILAKQNGNDNYNPAESVLQTLEIASLGTENQTLENQVKLYPSLAKNIIRIETTNSSVLNITIYDINGRILKTVTKYNSKEPISVNMLSNGNYLVKIQNNKGEITMKKFVKF